MPRPLPIVIKIADMPWQILCYGRYREREGHKDLTEMQKRVRQAMRVNKGNQAAAAESLGVRRQCIQGHVSLIESKGWSC